MKLRHSIEIFAVAGLALILVCTPACEALEKMSSDELERCGGLSSTASGDAYRTVRTFLDPGTGRYWLLAQRIGSPQPAVMRELALDSRCESMSRQNRPTAKAASPSQGPAVVRAGESVLLSEETNTSSTYLEAVALSAAAKGEMLTVRLRLSGLLVRAVAVEGGRVSFLAQGSEVWR